MPRVAGLAAAALLLARFVAAADAPPRALPALWERLLEVWPEALGLLGDVRPLVPDAVPGARQAARCHARLRAATAACVRGTHPRAVGCAGIFRRAAAALARRAAAPPSAHAPLAEAAEAADRIAFLLRAVRRGCVPEPAGADVPAVVTRVTNTAAVHVAPARALDPGARWQILVPLAGVTGLEPPLTPDGRLAAGLAVEPALPSRAQAFFASAWEAARRAPGLSVHPTLAVRLAAPAGRIRPGRVRFRRVTDGAPADRVLRTAAGTTLARDARRARAAGRKATRTTGLRVLDPRGAEAAALGVPAAALPHVARLVSGRFLSRTVGSGRATRVPFLLTVPAGGRAAPVVLLLHGLHGTGTAFLLNRADLLAARGVAAVVFDLPGHGGRAAEGSFFVPAEPETFVRGMRQAVTDALALAAALRAGLPAPAAGLLASDPPRLLGYSLGAMLGTLALGVEPDLGAAVLVAPAGDLFAWLALHTALGLRLPLLVCAGGPHDGADCLARRTCASGGVCAPPPTYWALTRVALAYRTLVADVDPETWAARAGGPDGRRPVLVQLGTADEVIQPGNTAWLATTLGADPTCRLRPDTPQTLCAFPGEGHGLVNRDAPREQAHGFLASAGRDLGPDAPGWAAR